MLWVDVVLRPCWDAGHLSSAITKVLCLMALPNPVEENAALLCVQEKEGGQCW